MPARPRVSDIGETSTTSTFNTPTKRSHGPEVPKGSASAKRSRRVEAEEIPTFPEDPTDPLVFAFYAVSPTSTFQQSCSIAITTNTIRFIDSNAVADSQRIVSIPRNDETYVFLVPHPENTKPHWSVIVLARGTQQQYMSTVPKSPLSITTKVAAEPEIVHPEGSDAGPLLVQAFSNIKRLTVQNPRDYTPISLFVTARLDDADGALYLLPNGILWNQRPCQFFELSCITQVRPTVREFGPHGHFATFSICVFVRSKETQKDAKLDEPEDKCVEFTSVDEDNMSRVCQWIKARKNLLFNAPQPQKEDPSALRSDEQEDSDSSDEDFEPDVSDLDSEPPEEFNEAYDSDGEEVGDDSFFGTRNASGNGGDSESDEEAAEDEDVDGW